MRKKIISKVLIIILLGSLEIGYTGSAGEVSLKSLELMYTPRVAALANSFAALDSEYNPSCLIYLVKENKQIFNMMYSSHIADINYGCINYVRSLGLEKAMSLSLFYIDSGSIEKRIDENTTQGTYKAVDTILKVCYAKNLSLERPIYIGCALKLLSSKIEKEKANGACVDVGLVYKINQNLKLGFVMNNLGTKLKYIEKKESLPFLIKAGISYEYKPILFVFDITKAKDSDLYFNIGAELGLFDKLLNLRVGYNSLLKDLSGLTAGFSITPNKLINIDYAFLAYGELKQAHKIALCFKF